MKRMNTMRAAGMTLLAVLLGAAAPQQAWAALGDNVKIQKIEIISEPAVYYADPGKAAQPIQFEVTLADFTDPLNPRSVQSVSVQSVSKLALQLNIPFGTDSNRATALINPSESTSSLIFDYYPRPGDLSDYLAWRSYWASATTAKRPFTNIGTDIDVTIVGDPYGFTLKAANLTFDPAYFSYTTPPAEQFTVEGLGMQFSRVPSPGNPSLENPVYVGTFPLTITSNGNTIPWLASESRDLRLWATDTAGNVISSVSFKSANTSISGEYATMTVHGGDTINQTFYVTVPAALSGQAIQIRFGLYGGNEPAYILRTINVIDDPTFASLTPDQFRAYLNIYPPNGRIFSQNAPGDYLDITYVGTLSAPRQGIISAAPLSAADQAAGYVNANTIINFGDLHAPSAIFTLDSGIKVRMLITPITGAYGITKVRIAVAGMEDTYYKDVNVEILQDQIKLSVVWENPLQIPSIIERSGLQSTWTVGRAMLVLSQPTTSTLRFNLYAYDNSIPNPLSIPAGPSKIFTMVDSPGKPDPTTGIMQVTIPAGSTNSPVFYVYGLDDKGANATGTGSGTGFIYPVPATVSDSNSYDASALVVTVENKEPVIISYSPPDEATYSGGTAVPFSITIEDTTLDALTYVLNFGDRSAVTNTITKAQRTNYRETITLTHVYPASGASQYTWTLDVWDDSGAHSLPLSAKINLTSPQVVRVTPYWTTTAPGFGYVDLSGVGPGDVTVQDNFRRVDYNVTRGTKSTTMAATPYLAASAQKVPYVFTTISVSPELDSFFYRWQTPQYPDQILPVAHVYELSIDLDLKKAGEMGGTASGGSGNNNQRPEDNWADVSVQVIFVPEWLKEDNAGDYNSDGLPDAWLLNYFGEAGRLELIESEASKAGTKVAGDFYPQHGWDDARFGVGANGFGRSGGSSPQNSYIPHADHAITYLDKVRGRDNTTLNANGIPGKTRTSNSSWFISIPNGDDRQVIALQTVPGTGMSVTPNGIVYTTATGTLVAANPDEQAALDAAGIDFNTATGTITTPADCVLAIQDDEVSRNLLGRMDPSMADTDNDGMTDAWEYYFWYYASRIYHAPAADGTGTGQNAAIYTELWPKIDPTRANAPGWVTYQVTTLVPSGTGYDTVVTDVTRNFAGDANLLRRWPDGSIYYEGTESITVNGVKTVVRTGEKLVRNPDGSYARVRRTIADLGINKTHPVPLTTAECPFVLGMAFNVGDPTVGIPIPVKKVLDAFNPVVKAGTTADTDSDGLSDYEEFVRGTNPIHWDSDGDGMSDYWEVLFGLNPNDASDANGNPDKDAMAYYVDEETGEELKHSAVFDRLGFNPLTGWLLNTRSWVNTLPDGRSATVSIYPVNTVAFTNIEEYRSMVDNVRLNGPLSVNPDSPRWIYINSPDPMSSDTDGDSVPDGWELYIGYSPTNANDSMTRVTERGAGGVWTARNEFSSLFSYLECTGRFDSPKYETRLGSGNITMVNWQWVNKLLPTNPDPVVDEEIVGDGTILIGAGYMGKGLGGDTDQDGVMDNEEAIFPYFYGAGTRTFIYGEIPDVREARDVTLLTVLKSKIGCYPGGGLNPTSMDTDLDGIPDGWEVQFAGTLNASGNGIAGGMDGTTCLDSTKDNDHDGLTNYQEYLTQLLRHVRYDLGEDAAPLNMIDPDSGAGFSAVVDLLAPSPELLNRWSMGELLAALANGLVDADELRQEIVGSQIAQYEVYRTYYENRLVEEDNVFASLTAQIRVSEASIVTLKAGLRTAETELTNAEDDAANAFFNYLMAESNYTRAVKNGTADEIAAALLALDEAWDTYERTLVVVQNAEYDVSTLKVQLTREQNTLQTLIAQRDARVLALMALTPADPDYDYVLVGWAERYYSMDQAIKNIELYEQAYLNKLAERGFNGGLVANTFEWDPAAVPSNINSSDACYYITPVGMHLTLEMLKKADPTHQGYWLPTDFQVLAGVRPTYNLGMFISTDPNMPDSDVDGMDDYFEVYHGLNPILGAADYAVRPEPGVRNIRTSVGIDRIASAYYGAVGPSQPAGMALPLRNPFGNPSMATTGAGAAYDFYQYPWMAGLPYADPDADGISNADEAVNPTANGPGSAMTDPSPLWFTDPTNPNSFVARFYNPTGITNLGDGTFVANSTPYPNYWVPGADYFQPFEINEGFDTDIDGIGDKTEVRNGTSPQNQESPYRRQAIHFNGNGALQTYMTFMHGPTSLRSFTVEAWVRPDRITGDQVIVERSWMTEDAANVTDPASIPTMIRRNFRLGLKDGKPYGLFTNSASADTVITNMSSQVLATGEWAHLAIRYSFDEGVVPSTTAKNGIFDLRINGRSVKAMRTSLVPATGILSYMPSFEQNIGNVYSYRSAPVFVGAAPQRPNDMPTMMADVDETATMGDVYTDFFQGYIDEVRIWNGARTDAQLTEWVDKVMPASYASTNRWNSFIKRYQGNGHYTVLNDAELVALYNFDTLFTVAPDGSVQTEPTGMAARTLNVPSDPGAEDSFFYRTVQPNLYSSVYTSNRYVPWLKNTVGHLPMMDISIYYLYTMQTNYTENAQTNFIERADVELIYKGPTKVSNSFYWTPHSTGNTAAVNPMTIETNPYGFSYRTTLEFDPVTYWELPGYAFRSANDLLPLGDAAAWTVEMWDGSSSSILPPEDLEEPDNWAALLDPGSCLTAGQEFLDQIAQGQTADSDGDGIPDWWENYFGFNSNSAADSDGWFADPDGDGLYNYAEYRAGTNPNVYSSTGKGLPDFHTALWDTRGKPTYGFLYTDHDFMEDAWERKYFPATSVDLHDAWNDPDNDGWSNWAEARANPFGFSHSTRPDAIQTIIYGDKTIPEYPEPVLPITFDYFGRKAVTNDTAAIVVNTYTTPDMNGKPDATFRIPLTTARVEKTQVMGNDRWGTVKGVLDPGHIAPATFKVRVTRSVPANGSTDFSIDEDSILYYHDDLGGEAPNGETGNIVGTVVTSQGLMDDILGSINYVTGEYTLTQSPETNSGIWSDTGTSSIGNVLTATYEYAIPTTEFPLSFSLVKPTYGHVREGRNYITAFIDYNGDGLWNEGEPAGMTDTLTVDVGWDRVEDIHIGLTDEPPPGTVRVEIDPAALAKLGSATFVIMDEHAQSTFFTKRLVSPKNNIMEADIVTGTDTGYLPGSNNPNVNRVVYQVVYKPDDGSSPRLVQSVTNTVKAIKQAEMISPINSMIIATSRPTIEWTCDIQPVDISIKVTSKSTGSEVYFADAILCPGPVKSTLKSDGSSLNTYRMTLPLNAGDMDDSTGRLFANGDYTVTLALKGPTNSKTITGTFRLDAVSSTNATQYGEYHSGYYKARVIYNGVLQESALSGIKLYVRAFTTASFNGTPAAAAATTAMGSISSRDPLTGASVANVELTGLNLADTSGAPIPYYTMAFLDLNKNGTWDHWEPWGYAITGNTSDYYYDAAASYAHRSATSVVTTFFIQDVDTDNDKLADSWEWLQYGKPDSKVPAETFLRCLGTSSSGSQNGSCWPTDGSGGGCSTPSSLMMPAGLDAVDTDGDGLSDFLEQLLGTNPNVAGERVDGLTDLQAYSLFGAVAGDSFDLFIQGIRQTAPGKFDIDWNWYNRTRIEAVRSLSGGSATYELQFSPELGQNATWKTIHSTTGSAAGGSIPVDPGTPRGFFRLKLK